MKTLIVSSTEDPASTNIKKGLLQHPGWISTEQHFSHNPIFSHQELDLTLVTINTKTIITEHIEDALFEQFNYKADQIIYISRHRSKTGEPTLTAHPIGNFGDALFGGKRRTLVPSNPHLMTALLRHIKTQARQQDLTHSICYEVTHHGPFLKTPTLFVEVGSTIDEWEKQLPATVIADALFTTLEQSKKQAVNLHHPVLIGLGGGHYAPRFTDLAFTKQVSFGHMIPNYQVNEGVVDTQIIKHAYEMTPGCQGVYIHKKGLSKPQVREYTQLIEEMGLPIVSSKDLDDL